MGCPARGLPWRLADGPAYRVQTSQAAAVLSPGRMRLVRSRHAPVQVRWPGRLLPGADHARWLRVRMSADVQDGLCGCSLALSTVMYSEDASGPTERSDGAAHKTLPPHSLTPL